MVYVEDDIAYPTMIELAACLCTTIEARGLPMPCQCSVVPGPQAILDSCSGCDNSGGCGGQAWVRLVTEYPSKVFPQPDTDLATCDTPMAYVLEVGISRCLPTGSTSQINGYTPPSLDQQVEAVRLQMADKAAITAAIRCCMNQNVRDFDYSLGAYTPLAVSGDCGGGFRQVTIWSV